MQVLVCAQREPSWITVTWHTTDFVSWLHCQYTLLPRVAFLQYEKPWVSTSSVWPSLDALSITSKVTGLWVDLSISTLSLGSPSVKSSADILTASVQSASCVCTSSTRNVVEGFATVSSIDSSALSAMLSSSGCPLGETSLSKTDRAPAELCDEVHRQCVTTTSTWVSHYRA